MPEWKLYVWEGVLCDNTCGLAFCVARSKEDAIKLLDKQVYVGDLKRVSPKIHNLKGLQRKNSFGYAVYGGG